MTRLDRFNVWFGRALFVAWFGFCGVPLFDWLGFYEIPLLTLGGGVILALTPSPE